MIVITEAGTGAAVAAVAAVAPGPSGVSGAQVSEHGRGVLVEAQTLRTQRTLHLPGVDQGEMVPHQGEEGALGLRRPHPGEHGSLSFRHPQLLVATGPLQQQTGR